MNKYGRFLLLSFFQRPDFRVCLTSPAASKFLLGSFLRGMEDCTVLPVNPENFLTYPSRARRSRRFNLLVTCRRLWKDGKSCTGARFFSWLGSGKRTGVWLLRGLGHPLFYWFSRFVATNSLLAKIVQRHYCQFRLCITRQCRECPAPLISRKCDIDVTKCLLE